MATIAAGFLGGIAEDFAGQDRVQLARDVMDESIGREELMRRLDGHWPRTLSVVVNNTCNLRCRHCYLQVDELYGAPLSVAEWTQFFESVASTGVHLIALAGKEVFLGRMGIDLLASLARVKKASATPIFRIGVITNGTLLAPHRDAIAAAELSYLDVSIDGLPEDHDAVRGTGAFNMALPNLRWAVREFKERFFVTCTLQQRNLQTLSGIVRHFDALGVQNLGFGFYRAQSYTDADLALTRSDIRLLLERVASVELEAVDHLRTITFDMGMLPPELFTVFLASPWFDPNLIKADKSGEVFIPYTLANGLTVNFRFALWPTGFFVTSRITPEGHYLASEDTLDTRRYRVRYLCSARACGLDFARMHAQARISPRLAESFDHYWKNILPMFRAVRGTSAVTFSEFGAGARPYSIQ